MSTVKTINLLHPSSASNNVVLTSGGGVTMGGTVTMSGAVSAGSLTVNSIPILAGPAFGATDTSTTATAAVATKIVFDTELFDTASAFDGSKFQPTTAGYYMTTLSVRNGNNANAGAITPLIYKNGSAETSATTYNGAGFAVNACVSAVIYLNGSTDYLEFYGTNTSNANLGVAYVTCSLVRAA